MTSVSLKAYDSTVLPQASKAQKTLAADCRKCRVILSILPHFLPPWRFSRRSASLLLWCPPAKCQPYRMWVSAAVLLW